MRERHDRQPIKDRAGNCGFPGFDGALAKNTLGMVAQMQENGVPVTYAYISDAHDNHTLGRAPPGPGEADYKQQLADYDTAFAAFFSGSQATGSQEQHALRRHRRRGRPLRRRDGHARSRTARSRTRTRVQVLDRVPVEPDRRGQREDRRIAPGGEPAYDIHCDDAPTFYVNGSPTRTDPPSASSSVTSAGRRRRSVRRRRRGADRGALADPVEEQTLHMVNTDPKRTPTFTMFGNADFFFHDGERRRSAAQTSASTRSSPGTTATIQEEIGEHVARHRRARRGARGVNDKVWADHTDTRPTMLSLLGLTTTT